MHSNSVEMRGNGISITRKSSSSSSSMKCRMKSALTRIPGIVFYIAGPRMEAQARKPTPASFRSCFLSYPFASRRIFNFALSSSSSSTSSQKSHCTRHDEKSFRSPSRPYTSPSMTVTSWISYIMNISIIWRTKIILQQFASHHRSVVCLYYCSNFPDR